MNVTAFAKGGRPDSTGPTFGRRPSEPRFDPWTGSLCFKTKKTATNKRPSEPQFDQLKQ